MRGTKPTTEISADLGEIMCRGPYIYSWKFTTCACNRLRPPHVILSIGCRARKLKALKLLGDDCMWFFMHRQKAVHRNTTSLPQYFKCMSAHGHMESGEERNVFVAQALNTHLGVVGSLFDTSGVKLCCLMFTRGLLMFTNFIQPEHVSIIGPRTAPTYVDRSQILAVQHTITIHFQCVATSEHHIFKIAWAAPSPLSGILIYF